jgi:hypothetical protein
MSTISITPATRSLLVREGRCDRLERAGKARASVIWPSISIAFPATSRPSHRPGDPDQKETEAPANADFVPSTPVFVMICRNMFLYFCQTINILIFLIYESVKIKNRRFAEK